jgi:thiamine-phosphate pyrophosphorylase
MHRIQYISQGTTQEEQLFNIENVLKAGCQWVQLRFKNADEVTFLDTAKKTKELCVKYNALFIINDHIEVAKEVHADGIHLGLTDATIAEARAILGEGKIIGGTTNTYEDVLQRIDEKCDYVGLGPFQFTTTKEKLSPVLGLEGYKSVLDKLKEHNLKMPIYAIGGIEEKDIQEIINLGITGVAISGLLTHNDKRAEIIKKYEVENPVLN